MPQPLSHTSGSDGIDVERHILPAREQWWSPQPRHGVAGAQETIDERGFYTMLPAPRYEEAIALTP